MKQIYKQNIISMYACILFAISNKKNMLVRNDENNYVYV